MSVSKGRSNAAFVFSDAWPPCCHLAAVQGHTQAKRATSSASEGNTTTRTKKRASGPDNAHGGHGGSNGGSGDGAAMATPCASLKGVG